MKVVSLPSHGSGRVRVSMKTHSIRYTPDGWDLICRAARAARKDPATYAREASVREAQRALGQTALAQPQRRSGRSE